MRPFRFHVACQIALSAAALLLAPLGHAVMPAEDIPALDARFSDSRFFNEELNLDFPGMEAVKAAVKDRDYAAAKAELGAYYRSRQIPVWEGSPTGLALTAKSRAQGISAAQNLLTRKTLEGWWSGAYTINYWHNPTIDFFPRMYWWGDISLAYLATQDPEVARIWVGLMRSFIAQVPPPADGKEAYYWEAMRIGIRMRGGWPACFATFIDAPEFTDQDIVNFLKSVIEQVEFTNKTHWPTGNKIAFSMVGVFGAGSAFPELTRAPAWRSYALERALGNIEDGYLPDKMGIELSPGYHHAFKNYLTIVEIAKVTEQSDPLLQELVDRCRQLFEVTATLSAPDRTMPVYQDSGVISLPREFADALKYYPDSALFQWFTSDGKQGSPPDHRSIALPYAGYIAMRTGWEADANYVGMDVGPIGYGHAHQDKLNVVLWAYGRPLLIDPGNGDYSNRAMANWAADTFAHNTALVDNRPQRRRWGKSGGFMPKDKPLDDYTFQTGADWDYAAGIYDESYGLPGESSSYPYGKDSNFNTGWKKPALHNRRVFFLHPDVVLVADTMVSRDGKSHTYELRWTLDSTAIEGPLPGAGAVRTTDRGKPNLAVIPMNTAGLETQTASAHMDPIIGWNFQSKKPTAATTIRHTKSGSGSVAFLTLLLPAQRGQELTLARLIPTNEETVFFELSDGRRFKASIPADPAQPLQLTKIEAEQ